MKLKIFIFALICTASPLCAITQELLNEKLANAVEAGNVEQIESCLLQGAHPDTRIADWKIESPTALIFTAELGNVYIVKLLLDHHADVNAQDSIKETALMKAAKKGDIDIVKLLLEHKADINIPSCGGCTALIIAAQNDNIEIIKLLLDHHADINANTYFGMTEFVSRTALGWGSLNGFSQVVNILLKHNANITTDKDSPLTIATRFNHFKSAELLLKHINHILDKTDDPKIWHKWDQYIFDALSKIKPNPYDKLPIDIINTFRMLLHHANKLPLSIKKFESLTIRAFRHQCYGEKAFRKTVEHLRTHAF